MKALSVGTIDFEKVGKAVGMLKTHKQAEVARELGCTASTIRRWARMAHKIKEYRVELVGKGVTPMGMAVITSKKGPLDAAMRSLREFPAIRALSLPDWEVHVNGEVFKLSEVRKCMRR